MAWVNRFNVYRDRRCSTGTLENLHWHEVKKELNETPAERESPAEGFVSAFVPAYSFLSMENQSLRSPVFRTQWMMEHERISHCCSPPEPFELSGASWGNVEDSNINRHGEKEGSVPQHSDPSSPTPGACCPDSLRENEEALADLLLPRRMKAWQWLVLSTTVLLATLLLALDNTVVADLQPQIVDALGEISKFPWINLTYSLGGVATSLLW